MWKPCIQNPFSELLTRAVDDLMELTESHGEDRPKISDVILLLTSGRLTRLDLFPFDLEAEKELIVRTLQTVGSNYLLNLDSYIKKPVIIYLVRKIISWNPHIEELHLDIHPGFDIIRKCQKLRILRLYSSKYVFGCNFLSIHLSVLSSLRNLEVLHNPHMDAEMIANVLEICPKLISIGLSDSLDSLEEIAKRRLKNSL
ncbi:hypothetical protein AVEN_231705-1 [Araneus ventricosus]|uniref:Uncharacterized protein n=1 Tax=Araneus ventricosus TaxID=182803 RepID=A0A4Y2R4I7_ARAVE|nr:hypothetical protein AVEN_231705-1 [Araneus ventricosus]